MCKGLIFRCSQRRYYSSKYKVLSETYDFRLRKNLSCGECPECQSILEDLKDRGCMNDLDITYIPSHKDFLKLQRDSLGYLVMTREEVK